MPSAGSVSNAFCYKPGTSITFKPVTGITDQIYYIGSGS
jgi:hypothetical protein